MKIVFRIFDAIKFLANMIFIYYFISTTAVIYSFFKRDGCVVETSWAAWTCKFLNAKFTKLSGSHEPIQGKKAIILVNHRSWSDFFVHDRILNYNANFLSRYLVGVAFPVAFFASPWMKTLWFFKRDAPRKDFAKFYQWIDTKWSRSKRENLLVYPEGHRMFESENPGPLKKGMLKYAYENKLPIQIMISHGNENLINEKKVIINRGTNMTYYIDAPFESSAFPDFNSFFSHVEKSFAENFTRVYRAHYNKKAQ